MTAARRPKALLAHYAPGIDFFTTEDLALLAEVVDLLDTEAVGAWDDPRAEALLAEVEVIIGHWGCPALDAAILDRAPHVGLFAYAAGTVKETVTPDVFDRVRVTSGARANAEPVAEFTLGAILLANKAVFWRRLGDGSGPPAPPRAVPPVAVGNWAKTIGIVGASLVGRRVIELLRPFPALRVAIYDPFLSEEQAEALGVAKLELDELCATADVLSIHAPDLPSTRGMIGAAQLAALRNGATVINTARGRLLDHDALVAELTAGRLTAILDVTDPEPLPDDHPLRSLSNAYLTPHLAGSEGTELARMALDVADEVRRWVAGEPALNEVHASQLDRLA